MTASDKEPFIVFRFVSFSVETHHDFISVGFGHNVPESSSEEEGSMVLKLSGVAAPNSLTINGTTAWVTVITDDATAWWGFIVTVESSELYGKLYYESHHLYRADIPV